MNCIRAHIARWCAKSNRSMNIVKDRQFEILMKTGWPGTSIPSPMTVSHAMSRLPLRGVINGLTKFLRYVHVLLIIVY